jgi:microtubule-associated protein-like 6
MLAIWDIKTRRQQKFARLDCGGNVLTYTSDGARLAIGYINGSVTLLDANFQVIAIRKDRKEQISEIKFSPDNTICAVGAHDSQIFTYDAKNNMKPLKKIRGHHSTIQHFDFS